MANKGPTVFNNGEPLFEPSLGEWPELYSFKKMFSELPLLIRICLWWYPFYCITICHMQYEKVRGIPVGSVSLSQYEKDQLCQRLAGHWKIQPLQGLPFRTVQYTDAMIRDDSIILTGGMHNSPYGAFIDTQEQKIIPFRAPNGTLFVDNIGSILVRDSIDGGEIEMHSAKGIKLLLQRRKH